VKSRNHSLWVLLVISFGLDAKAATSADEESLTRAFGDETFISIATGYRQPASLAPAVASVITDKNIKEMGAKDIDEVLETVPGLHVSIAPRGYLSLYTIRGIYSENNPQVLFLINGIPITNLFVGNRGELWGGMPVNDISRIEVMRGPGSALYGADAFAGTINIITKTAQEIQGTEAGARAGSFNTHEGWFLYGGNWHGFDSALSLEVLDTDGSRQTVESDSQTYYDKLFGTKSSFAPGPVSLGRKTADARLDLARGDWRLRVGYQGRRDLGTGAGVALAKDPTGSGRSDRFNADLTYDRSVGQKWNFSTIASYLDTTAEPDLVLYPPGAFGGAFPDGVIARPYVYERHARLGLAAVYYGFDKHALRLGAGVDYGDLYKVKEVKNYAPDGTPLGAVIDVTNDPNLVFMRPHDRTVYYTFAQDEWDIFRDWRLTAGIRYDHYSDFGDTTNPRVALVWQTSYALTTKLLYGRAFRAPAFNELYNINNPIALGNPNLKPETIDTYELAFNYQWSNELQTDLNLFDHKMSDVIRFAPPTFTAENIGNIRGKGLEFEARYNLGMRIQLLGNYSIQHSHDSDTGAEVANAPRRKAYGRAIWKVMPDWTLSAQANWVADRARDVNDTRSPIRDYVTADFVLRYAPMPWEIAASVRNAFNANAREPSPRLFPDGTAMIPNDLPLPNRNYFIEARYYFH
jgi:outer membrane receptor protein involved in Fe transport